MTCATEPTAAPPDPFAGAAIANLLDSLIFQVEAFRVSIFAAKSCADGTIPDEAAAADLESIESLITTARTAAAALRAADPSEPQRHIDPKTSRPYLVLNESTWHTLPTEAQSLYAWDLPSQRYALRGAPA